MTTSPQSLGAPAGGDALVQCTASELSAMIARRQVSCVEVMEAHLDQIDRHNPTLNAIIGLRDRGEVLAEARQCDAEFAAGHSRGWMHGLPHAIKDLAAARGLPHTCGSPIYADRVADTDDLVVRRIREAGAIIIGKTNTPEFGLGSQTYNPVWGATATPYDVSRTAGGSSGGGAAAVAARMLPVADGSDHMGSLRNPPAFTNTIGFRPSWGRIPEPGFIAYGGVSGAMGRTVTDVARLLSTMAGPDRASALGIDDDPKGLSQDLDRDISGTTVAWVGDWDGYLATEPGILSLCEDALGTLRGLGCRVDAVLPRFDPARIWDLYLTWRSWGNLWLADLYDDPDVRALMKPELVWELERGLRLSARDITRAAQERAEWYAVAADLFSTYDVVIAPSAQVFPFDKTVHWPTAIDGRPMDTYHRWMETVAPWTMTGHPVAAMPAGFNAAGLPTGIQIIGGRHADHAVLQIAYAYEQATQWVRRRPPLG
ncbi:amidase [Leekyejoonella antrihumi]|uniref:amidase n=1 Tax=Leekyejoonella antrihumi TaxID=1660198 RepID=UPI001C968D36|nr:amidase [Leekyejoonella antrihumi]